MSPITAAAYGIAVLAVAATASVAQWWLDQQANTEPRRRATLARVVFAAWFAVRSAAERLVGRPARFLFRCIAEGPRRGLEAAAANGANAHPAPER